MSILNYIIAVILSVCAGSLAYYIVRGFNPAKEPIALHYWECRFKNDGKFHKLTFHTNTENEYLGAEIYVSNYCSVLENKQYKITSLKSISEQDFNATRKSLHLQLGHYNVYTSN